MVNNYTPPRPIEQDDYHLTTSSQDYDFNFCFAVPSILTTTGVALEPLIPSLHAIDLHNYLTKEPELATFLPYGPFLSLREYLTFLEARRQESSSLLFIIRDLSLSSNTPNIAGIVGVLNCSSDQRVAEIGHIQILKQFQRSHVGTHTVGLLLKYLLDVNKVRRCVWQANSLNRPSIATAERMTFHFESVQIWARVLPESKQGIDLPRWAVEEDEDELKAVGRHSAVLVIYWDDWREEKRKKVQSLMDRKVIKRDASAVGR